MQVWGVKHAGDTHRHWLALLPRVTYLSIVDAIGNWELSSDHECRYCPHLWVSHSIALKICKLNPYRCQGRPKSCVASAWLSAWLRRPPASPRGRKVIWTIMKLLIRSACRLHWWTASSDQLYDRRDLSIMTSEGISAVYIYFPTLTSDHGGTKGQMKAGLLFEPAK